ncbi:MAG: TPM domain-containing protein [Williamsia sp.]|nr:TPM domain-containing protein [Williamsia sp.]
MKKFLLLLACFVFTLAVSAQNVPDRPNPPRLVNDFAHALTDDQIQALESKLVAYDDSTSNQIAIVTISTTGDYAIEDYALAILRKWGVGNKKNNNGIVILAAIKDRKVRIETGYGLEGAIPDAIANQIIQSKIIPNFRGSDRDNYYRGFDQAIDDIIKAARGEYKAPEGYAQRGRRSAEGGGAGIGFIILIIILIFIFSRRGGGGGGMMSRRGYGRGGSFWGGFLGGMIGSELGRGSGGGWSSGGGGGWSGGGGGGFGGFGGGSGGGGGASGSW